MPYPSASATSRRKGSIVDIQNSQTGMISAQALQANSAQIGTTAAAAIMTVREQNGDLVSFFNLKRNAGTFLVVLKDSPIQKLEDLKGKTIGAPSFGAGGGLGLKQNLSEIGITPDQYTGISTGAGTFGDRGAAHRPDRGAGDVGRDARRRREHRAVAAHRQHPARGRPGRDDPCGQEILCRAQIKRTLAATAAP